MTVQEAIDILLSIEDKSLQIKFVDQYNDLNGEYLDTIYIDDVSNVVRLGN